MAEAGGVFSSAEQSLFGPGPVPGGKINSGSRLFSVGQRVMGVCVHTGCVVGACVCAPGCVCRCGSVTVCDPRSGFVLGLLGVCTRAIQVCVVGVVCTFAVYGSVWGI